MDTVKLIESRMKQIEAQRDALMNDPEITRYLDAVSEYIQKTQDREMNVHERRSVAQCLQNAIDESGLRSRNRLFEATTEDNISFLGIQLPVIAALLPSLALNEIAIVQALDRRVAAVFFLDVKYGTTKGAVTAGEDMITALTGHTTSKAGRRYAMARVVDEVLSGDGGNGNPTGTVLMAANNISSLINLENVKIETLVSGVRTTLGTSNAAGTIVGGSATGQATGSIDTAGAYDVTVSLLDSDVGPDILITYDYQYDLPEDAYGNKTGVPEVDVGVQQETVEAIDFPLRAKYSVGASIDLQKAHGINLEDELVKYLGNEVKFTIDQVGLDMIDDAAKNGTITYRNDVRVVRTPATAPTIWNAKMGHGQEWLWKKHELMDRFEEGSNNIFKKTKRGVATFIHCGNNVARVIRQLPDFKPSSGMGGSPPTGPMKIGELLGRVVIQNPFKQDDKYTLGFRGDHYLYAGFIYCPYIPLFATPTLITSDLMAQKGFLSSAGFKVINPGLFCEGEITGLGTTEVT